MNRPDVQFLKLFIGFVCSVKGDEGYDMGNACKNDEQSENCLGSQ